MPRLPMAARREQLVHAALTVAIRDGIEAATIRAVAAEAGVSLGVVHYCFEDKDELLREVGLAITTKNVEHLAHSDQAQDGAARPRTDSRTAVGGALEIVWDSIRQNRGAQLLSYELTTTSLRSTQLGGVAAVQLEHKWELAEGVLTQAAQASGTSWSLPVRQLARLVVAAIDGVSLAWLVDGDDAAAAAALSAFADHLATFSRSAA